MSDLRVPTKRAGWLVVLALATGCGGGSAASAAWPVDSAALAFFSAPDAQVIVAAGSDGDGAAGSDVPRMRVHLIDVGQGAATLVEFPCAAILVDTGGEADDQFDSTRHLMHYLEAFFMTRPDLHDSLALLLLTHPHIDHTRGARAVWDRFHVANVVTDGGVTSSGGAQQAELMDLARARGIGLDKIAADDIPAGGLTDAVIDPVRCTDIDPDIRVFWGTSKQHGGWDMNNHSVVTKITFGKASILITGDLQDDGIAELLKHNADALRADVYEVGHHGSYNATTKPLLDAIQPKLALIAMGPWNRRSEYSAWSYGHPRDVTIDLLEHALAGNHRQPIEAEVAFRPHHFGRRSVTAPIFATGWDGIVRVSMYADGRIAVLTSGR